MRKGNIDNAKLKSFVERIENIEEQKAGLGSDVRDVLAEARSAGFCNKTIRKILKLRKMTHSQRTEEEYMLHLYQHALGMQSSFDFDGEGSEAV